jgi:hypothetical protein
MSSSKNELLFRKLWEPSTVLPFLPRVTPHWHTAPTAFEEVYPRIYTPIKRRGFDYVPMGLDGELVDAERREELYIATRGELYEGFEEYRYFIDNMLFADPYRPEDLEKDTRTEQEAMDDMFDDFEEFVKAATVIEYRYQDPIDERGNYRPVNSAYLAAAGAREKALGLGLINEDATDKELGQALREWGEDLVRSEDDEYVAEQDLKEMEEAMSLWKRFYDDASVSEGFKAQFGRDPTEEELERLLLDRFEALRLDELEEPPPARDEKLEQSRWLFEAYGDKRPWLLRICFEDEHNRILWTQAYEYELEREGVPYEGKTWRDFVEVDNSRGELTTKAGKEKNEDDQKKTKEETKKE